MTEVEPELLLCAAVVATWRQQQEMAMKYVGLYMLGIPVLGIVALKVLGFI
jgi:hypothetical protein